MAPSRHAMSGRLAMSLAGSPFPSPSSRRGTIPSESSQHGATSMDANINTLFTNLATTIRNVSVAVSVFAFRWGAIQYATSGGSPHQLELGKSAMKASVIGVGAVVLAATLVGIVRSEEHTSELR